MLRAICFHLLLAWLIGSPCDEPQLVQWPEADALFHADRYWLGADAAYSIQLDSERTLWLFGDTFIALDSTHSRRRAKMISNTIAIQHGLDPTTACISYYWRHSSGKPDAFFSLLGENRYWPSHGVMIGKELMLFLTVVGQTESGLGFMNLGTITVLVENPLDDPLTWKITKSAAPQVLGKRLLTGSAVLKHAGYIYAFSCEEPSHDQYLFRWSDSLLAHHMMTPDVWCGTMGWRQLTEHETPSPVMNAGTEFSVTFSEFCHTFIQTQSHGFGRSDIKLRYAPAPEGPWSAPITILRPEEYSREGIMMYAAKEHPELQGGQMIITYATNSSLFEGLADTSLYYPRFARMKQ